MIDEPGGYPPANVEIEGAWKPAFVLGRIGKSFELRLAGRADEATMTVQRNQLQPLFGNTGFRADED